MTSRIVKHVGIKTVFVLMIMGGSEVQAAFVPAPVSVPRKVFAGAASLGSVGLFAGGVYAASRGVFKLLKTRHVRLTYGVSAFLAASLGLYYAREIFHTSFGALSGRTVRGHIEPKLEVVLEKYLQTALILMLLRTQLRAVFNRADANWAANPRMLHIKRILERLDILLLDIQNTWDPLKNVRPFLGSPRLTELDLLITRVMGTDARALVDAKDQMKLIVSPNDRLFFIGIRSFIESIRRMLWISSACNQSHIQEVIVISRNLDRLEGITRNTRGFEAVTDEDIAGLRPMIDKLERMLKADASCILSMRRILYCFGR